MVMVFFDDTNSLFSEEKKILYSKYIDENINNARRMRLVTLFKIYGKKIINSICQK